MFQCTIHHLSTEIHRCSAFYLREEAETDGKLRHVQAGGNSFREVKIQHFKYKIQHFKYKLTCRPASSACSGACCCWCGNHHVSTEESSFVLKNHWRIIEESSFVLKNHWRIIEESFQSAPESPAFAPRASGTAPVLEATACCYPSK